MNKLFEPIQIGSMTLKNRIVMAPMGTTTDTTNAFNMRDVKYYGERAKGGCGLVLTGAVVASTEFEPAPCQKLTNTKDVYMLHLVAERVHFYGAKFGIQLSPGIGRMNWIDPHTPPYSASPVPNYYVPSLICRELPTEGVKSLVKAMGESAKLAKNAGVDIIEIHAYGGYLIDQFTSAKWNHRTDEYGGSFENRQRFLREIVEEVRKACGKDYPIAIKMTLDSVDDDERPIEEGLAIAKYLADSGLVDMIHFGRGAYSCRWRMVSSVYQPVGFDLDAAPKVREMIGDLPLMAHGKLNHPDVAEKAIADGLIDLVAIGHGLIADPHWANKVKNGKLDDINPCIGCGECHFNAMKGHSRPCAVNVHAFALTGPGTAQLVNVLSMQVVGEGPAAGLVGGLVGVVVEIVFGTFVLTLMIKKDVAKGLKFAYGPKDIRVADDKQLPNFLISLIPLLSVVIFFNVVKLDIFSSCLAAWLLSIVLLGKYMPKKDGSLLKELLDVCTVSGTNAFGPCGMVGSLFGFVSVVQTLPEFQAILNYIFSLNIAPFLVLILSINIVGALTGSSSSAIRIGMPMAMQHCIDAGMSLAFVQRLGAFAASILDTLPHSSAIIINLGIADQDMKEAYPPMAVTTILTTAVGTAAVAIFMSLFPSLP